MSVSICSESCNVYTGHDRILPPYARVADSAPTGDYMHKQYGGYRANGDTDIDMPVISSPEEAYTYVQTWEPYKHRLF